MKKIIFLTITVNFLINFYAIDSSVSWKTGKNMNEFIYKSENVELISLKNIPSFYELKRKVHDKETDLDMYLSFDGMNGTDETGNYRITYKKYLSGENKSIYKKSAYFLKDEDRIELERTGSSFFQPGINLNSFSIGFWMYPVSFSSNETIIKIGSQYYNKTLNDVIDQSIIGKVEDGKVNWEFSNLFTDGKNVMSSVKVESYSRVIPEKWTFVNLTYDSYKGIIREFINGRENGIKTVTEDGNINSTVYNLRFDPTNRCSVKIGSSFEGSIDELYIIKNSNPISHDRYDKKGGTILSNVMEIDRDSAYINNITIDEVKENNSDIQYYYRFSDKPFYPGFLNGDNTEPSWKILGNEDFKSGKIRFMQWKIVLLPGDNGEFSPRFKGITLDYVKDSPPSRPFGIKVLPGNHSVRIKWFPNSEKDIKGYKIYYGTKSGYYFGTEAGEGISPIDAGMTNEIEITGLNNEIIYYFSVTAYDDTMKTHESRFSEEVSARPLEKYGNIK